MASITLQINGMAWENSDRRVAGQLERISGVTTVMVDGMSRSAFIEFDGSRCRPEDLLAAVQRSGYQVDKSHLSLVDTAAPRVTGGRKQTSS